MGQDICVCESIDKTHWKECQQMMTLDRPQGWTHPFTLLSLHMQPCSLILGLVLGVLLPLSQHASISPPPVIPLSAPLPLKPPPLSLGHSPASLGIAVFIATTPLLPGPSIDSVSLSPKVISNTLFSSGDSPFLWHVVLSITLFNCEEIKIWRYNCTDRAGRSYLGVRGTAARQALERQALPNLLIYVFGSAGSSLLGGLLCCSDGRLLCG